MSASEAAPQALADAIPRLAALAARGLGWSADAFWTATPCDLALALGDPAAPAAPTLTRADLTRLMEHDNG